MVTVSGHGSGARARVVVVDDEAILARSIAASLQDLGHDVVAICATGEEAIAAAHRERPDLILMDVRLRGPMDGINATAEIHKARDVPVVFLTAYADREHIERATATSPYGYLVKPAPDRELAATVDVALQRHRSERVLAQREQWLTTVLGSIGDAVIVVDAALRVTFLNGAAAAVTGWTAEAALGRPVDEVFAISCDDGGPRENPLRRALAERAVTGLAGPTVLHPRGGSQPVPIDDCASPILDDQGVPRGGVIVFRDVTEQRRLEARVALAARLQSLGTLTAGLGHELNNPLFAAHANVQFARNELGSHVAGLPSDTAAALGAAAAALADADTGIVRSLETVARLNAFARPGDRPHAPVSMVDVIRRALRQADNELRHSGRVRTQLDDPAWVMGDADALVQAVSQLLSNAAQARDLTRPDHEVDVSLTGLADGRTQLVVRDSGVGIPPEQMVRIFEPFFTTKPVGLGNGLGLTIAHAIVRAHGGELWVTSTRGDTRFHVALPRCAAPALAPSPHATLARVRRAVLVIDDDPQVLATLKRMLQGHHAVTAAADAEEALALLAAGLTPDVVVCDLMMPGMGGIGLHAELTANRPELEARMLFLTGGAFTPDAVAFVARLGDRVLSKPITARELLLRIDAAAAAAAV